MSRRKRRTEEDDINPDSWLATYADTITLLMTFFVLLYSMSSVDSEKLQELAEALQNSLTGTTKVTEIEDLSEILVETGKSEYEDLVEKLDEIIQANSLGEIIKIREEDNGVVLQLDETILFDSARSELKENSKAILDIITTIVENVDNNILVEGHTDNLPITSGIFDSNWELSTARAVSVVRYFVETKHLDPTRFAVKGYGEFKPLVDNSTPENRSINRRVDILIVEQKEK